MINDDIRDLLGRYALGSLTAEEHKRLFDAALDDQELFDELAREDEMKELFAGPGVRDRLIRALEPPRRKVPWILALAPVAVLSALLIVVLMRPVPKPPPQVAVMKPLAPAGLVAPAEPAVSQPAPAGVPATRVKAKAVDQPRRDVKVEEVEKKAAENRPAEQKDAKAMDQVAAAPEAAPAPPAPPAKTEDSRQQVQVQAQASQVQQVQAQQQNAAGGPKQNAVQAARAMAPASKALGLIATAPAFGFHYAIQTPGHLIVVPSADGYLSVKSADGNVIFAPQRIAAGISTDIALSDSVRSLTILFSADATPAPVPSTVRTASSGTAQAPSSAPAAVAIELRINP